MSYRDRLREMTYVSPSGKSYTLEFDALSRTGGKKAPVSEYPGQDQGGVQDLGNTTPTFPVTCYITGSDYDQTADSFWDALHETGPGKLYHPRWGNINVLPIPNTQEEQFVEGCGRAVFDITFIKTNDLSFEYPIVSTDKAALVSTNVETAAETISAGVPEEITDTATLAGGASAVLDALDSISEGFDTITDLTDDVTSEISQSITDIENTIDDLISSPADLMTAVLELYRLPATVVTDIKTKIEGYSEIYENIIEGFVEATGEYGEMFGLISVAMVSGLGAAAAEATTEGDTTTRDEAAEVVETLSDLYTDIKDSIQDLEEAGSFSTDYETLLATEAALSTAIEALIDSALNLPAERSMTLDRSVDPITLCYEIFGTTDDLETWMEFNDFQGNEILLIPRGREVRWYVE
ncbi:MAG: DNA circularization N-terminal domain-containing protein [Spirochaetales bacterium]|nr:DNA circularization N-terminal domain-containing protein [Spirochaetales bacterium]